MTVWVIRAGSKGELEDYCLRNGIAIIDFGFRESLANFESRESLRDEMGLLNAVSNAPGQLWRFANDVQRGDMVVLPRKQPKVVAVGHVAGEYEFRPDLPNLSPGSGCHTRAIQWEAEDVPRSSFDQDLLYSFNGQLTLFQVNRDNAAERISQAVEIHLSEDPISIVESESAALDEDVPDTDLDEQIRDRIAGMIRRRFSGAGLERLVAAILRASGYSAVETRRGPDGGIDVLAGRGDMGFGEPRLAVQVKSGASPIGIADYNRLQGNIHGFGAQYGLLVSMGDFTRDVKRENERSFFQIRLWGPYELVDRLLESYDSLPEEIRAEIPLQTRRIPVESGE